MAASLVKPSEALALQTEAATIDVKNLGTFQRQDQLADFKSKAFAALNEVRALCTNISQRRAARPIVTRVWC